MNDGQNIDNGFAPRGSVRYMEAPALRRGLHIPSNIKGLIALLGLAALALATLVGMKTYSDVVNAPARYAESIQEAISTGPGLELPVLNNFIDSDNAGIRETFASTGYALIDVDAMYADEGEELDPNSMDMVKVPSDTDYDMNVDLFRNNLRRSEVTDAAHFLAGSWRFTSFTANGVDLKVKYADMNSASIEDAIAAAIAAQGWTDSAFGESGVDQSGNTFQNGTIQINDRTMHWSVSVCPLDEVYSVNGLPDAFYVGSRLVS